MKVMAKTEQLQIRVSSQEKKLIKRAARHANMSMSDWVLSKVLPELQGRFQELMNALVEETSRGFAFASLNDFLFSLTASEFKTVVAEPPRVTLDEYLSNYVAAIIEFAANQKNAAMPSWVHEIKPLSKPRFGTNLKSLRVYLLTQSPPPFRRRNIFIDSTLGDRV